MNKNNPTIEQLTQSVETASTSFEQTNTELKRKYLLWNIESFNIIASKVSTGLGTFGTGYPFYALDTSMNGNLPIICEQIRYNRQLVKDGKPFQKSIWHCKSCLSQNYDSMPDLKSVCLPCPTIPHVLKPRKIVNRLPDIDMWLVCQDGQVETAQQELIKYLENNNMHTSDVDPLSSIDDVIKISQMLKENIIPKIFLPIDTHIVEYSTIKSLIEQVPSVLLDAKSNGETPYLPIYPKSYRKQWQYDDEAYNYIYDFLSAFTSFNFPEDLQESLEVSRKEVASAYTPEELFDILCQTATDSNRRRFESVDLRLLFIKKMSEWQKLQKPYNNPSHDEDSR